MKAFFGVVFAMLALLSGGCSLLFIVSEAHLTSDEMSMFLTIGGIPALIFGLIAWALLRKRSFAPTAKDPRYGKDTPPAPPPKDGDEGL